jgi:purine-binding chemotaxis protein CheW
MIMTAEALSAAQYLTFRLGGEEYAVGILQVREILRFEEITRVPAAPPSIRGVLNLRGAVVPVVDLALKFGLPETVVTPRTCIVIVEVEMEGEATVMGVLADAVSQVIELGPGDVEPPPSFGTRVRIDFLKGMARQGTRFALLLDIDRLLATEVVTAAEALDESAAESVSGDFGSDAEPDAAVASADAAELEPVA